MRASAVSTALRSISFLSCPTTRLLQLERMPGASCAGDCTITESQMAYLRASRNMFWKISDVEPWRGSSSPPTPPSTLLASSKTMCMGVLRAGSAMDSSRRIKASVYRCQAINPRITALPYSSLIRPPSRTVRPQGSEKSSMAMDPSPLPYMRAICPCVKASKRKSKPCMEV